jgi:GNAT superfamily N-acetyltransferase
MTSEDLSAALRLSTSVGWNQIAADWQRMLFMEPGGCFVAEQAGEVVGTTLCCTFGPVAWLAMVIVREDQRGCGLGRELVRSGLDYARQKGIQTVRLDATRLGEAVYRKLGFTPQFELVRMGGIVRAAAAFDEPVHRVMSAEPSQIEQLIRMDQDGTRTDRGKLLRRLFGEWSPLVAVSSPGQIDGFLASRRGRLSTQFGPMSGTEVAAVDLFTFALKSSHGQPVIADIPVHRESLLKVARDFGLAEQRTLLRMCYGDPVEESPQRFHLSYGGELG